jgi:hypothetical protein
MSVFLYDYRERLNGAEFQLASCMASFVVLALFVDDHRLELLVDTQYLSPNSLYAVYRTAFFLINLSSKTAVSIHLSIHLNRNATN